jgi:hypothetical protein
MSAFGGLKCQVPGCKKIIHAMTGLQEITKMRAHMKRAHLASITPSEALELRAAWEARVEGKSPSRRAAR